MKTLLLFRHAKSSWSDPELADHDRPLKPRGIKAARRMGKLLREQNLHPDLVLCSTALRAHETLRLALEAAGIEPVIEYTGQLFHCDPAGFVSVLKKVDNSKDVVMVVGHNPGLEEFLSLITGQTEELPTAALVQLSCETTEWSQFGELTRGQVLSVWRPRELDEKS